MCYLLEDRIHALDVEEQKRNCLHDAEAEACINVHSIGDPYAPYTSPGLPPDDYVWILIIKQLLNHMSPSSNASPFQHGELYDDEYDDRKSFHSDEEPTHI